MGLEQAFSLCSDNNLSNNEWISHKFYYKVPYHQRKTGIDFSGCDLSQVRMTTKGPETSIYFFNLDNLCKWEWIALKLYHRMFWVEFVGFNFQPFRKKGPKSDCFNSGQIFIICQISNHNYNSQLYQDWMVCSYLPNGSASAVVLSFSL